MHALSFRSEISDGQIASTTFPSVVLYHTVNEIAVDEILPKSSRLIVSNMNDESGKFFIGFFYIYISFMNRKKTKVLKGIDNISGLCFSNYILRILKRPDIETNFVLIHLMMCATSHC